MVAPGETSVPRSLDEGFSHLGILDQAVQVTPIQWLAGQPEEGDSALVGDDDAPPAVDTYHAFGHAGQKVGQSFPLA